MSDDVKGVVVELEVGNHIQIGGSIYKFVRIQDKNFYPKLVFEWVRLA